MVNEMAAGKEMNLEKVDVVDKLVELILNQEERMSILSERIDHVWNELECKIDNDKYTFGTINEEFKKLNKRR